MRVTFVNAREVRETTKKSAHVCARVRGSRRYGYVTMDLYTSTSGQRAVFHESAVSRGHSAADRTL